LDYSDEIVVCPDCGRQNFRCSQCAAPVSLDKDAVAVSCPYCSATLAKKDLSTDKLFFPISFNETNAYEKLHRFLQNRFGIPEDIATEYNPVHISLIYVPLHIYHIKSEMTHDIIEVDTKGIVASNKIWFAQNMDNYKFAVKSKIYYKQDEIKGQIMGVDFDKVTADNRARSYGYELSNKDKIRFNLHGSPNVEIKYDGLIYYPVYEIEYGYKNEKYKGIIDATNGVAIYTEYPMGRKTRYTLRTMGAAYIVLSMIIGILQGIFLWDYISTLIVIGQGIVIGGVIISGSGSRKKGSEEISSSDKKLFLSKLDNTLFYKE